MLPFESPCAYYEGRRDSSRSSDQALQTELGTSSFTPFLHTVTGAWPLVTSWRSNLAALLGATAVLRPPLQL
jgi:hypothetical protein